MTEKKYSIAGMSCKHCVKSLEIELSEIDLESVQVDVGQIIIKFDETKISDFEIVKAVEEAGFKVAE